MSLSGDDFDEFATDKENNAFELDESGGAGSGRLKSASSSHDSFDLDDVMKKRNALLSFLEENEDDKQSSSSHREQNESGGGFHVDESGSASDAAAGKYLEERD